jgi:hypothetical protein
MPRFFFDVVEGGVTEPDEEGVIFADINSARKEALQLASDIAAETAGLERDITVIVRGEKKESATCSVRLTLTCE